MSSSIVILGASGHGREVAAAARAVRRVDPDWGLVEGFLDDSPAIQGQVVAGITILGTTDQLGIRPRRALLGVGYPEAKARLVARLRTRFAEWPALIHPEASLGERIKIGTGSLVQAGCVLTCDIELAEFVTLNCGATINHDVRIGRFATVSPGAHVAGKVSIEEGVFVGIGASVMQGLTVGAWSVIGAGATVVKSVPANAVVAGVPARVIKMRADGWQNE